MSTTFQTNAMTHRATADDGADPWAELYAIDRRFAIRVEDRFGRCEFCRLPPTGAVLWESITWAVCTPCQNTWPAGEVLALDKASVLELAVPAAEYAALMDSVTEENVHFLAQCQHIFPSTTPLSGAPMTLLRKKTGNLSDALFDPWPDATKVARPNLDDPNEPPWGWYKLSLGTRARIGGACGEGDPPGLRLGAWRRIRARFIKGGDGADGPEIAKALEPLYVDDPEERALWARVAREITDPEFRAGILILGEVDHKLQLAGDAIATLRTRRAAIDREIERLERRSAAVSA